MTSWHARRGKQQRVGNVRESVALLGPDMYELR
jgi:hypothetical protein